MKYSCISRAESFPSPGNRKDARHIKLAAVIFLFWRRSRWYLPTGSLYLFTSGAAGASFTSPRQLRQAIDESVAGYNPTAAPFEWKICRLPSKLKSKYCDLCK
jgi:hypothetical protein